MKDSNIITIVQSIKSAFIESEKLFVGLKEEDGDPFDSYKLNIPILCDLDCDPFKHYEIRKIGW